MAAPSTPGRDARRPWFRSTASALALTWAAVIVYASLYPFAGWRWPPGATASDVLHLPWPSVFLPFDIVANVLGYLPLGLLLATSMLRLGRPRWHAAAAATLVGALLSATLETLQHVTPQRVPSGLDAALNVGGTVLGLTIALVAHRVGWMQRWSRSRAQWIGEGHAGALALLVLWPIALVPPTPVPFALGRVGSELREAMLAQLAAMPRDWAWAHDFAERLGTFAAPAPLDAFTEAATVALGLLAPSLLIYASARRSWRRVLLAVSVAGIGALMTTLSTVLHHGSAHAFGWWSPQVGLGFSLALVLALVATPLGPRVAAGLGLVVLTLLAVLVLQIHDNPYDQQNLQAWEQGRFFRFHGLAVWLQWLWPYAALGWLLVRLSEAQARERPRRGHAGRIGP